MGGDNEEARAEKEARIQTDWLILNGLVLALYAAVAAIVLGVLIGQGG